MTTSPEERERINKTLARLKYELLQQDALTGVRLSVRGSSDAAERIRRLSEELRSLSGPTELEESNGGSSW